MSNDIGEDILKVIRLGMASEISGKGKIAEIIAKAENGKANFNDVSDLSTQLGNALSRLIAVNVTPDKLPNGRLYYNIANTFLTGSLKDNYDLINVTAQAVQESVDNKKSIKIEPQKADFPAERVHNIVNAVSDETVDWSTIERRLDSPIRNVTESFYNDYVETNAEFRSDAGLKPYIIRETDGNCCTWCSALAGQYEYPNGVPPDVYARHDNCTCTVTYVTDKYRQDVWSKKSYALTPEERKNVLENTPKPERFTRQQAKDVEKSNLKGAVGVANSGKSGIIKTEESVAEKLTGFNALSPSSVVNILRSEATKWIDTLNSEEIRAIKKYTQNSGDKKNNKFYQRLNAMLRGEIDKNSTLDYYAQVISSALKKNSLGSDIVCYRSVNINHFKSFKVGDIFLPKQFFSTSVSSKGALNEEYKMIIYARKGTKGAYIEQLSRFPKQREFLIDKDCAYRILSMSDNKIELEVIV